MSDPVLFSACGHPERAGAKGRWQRKVWLGGTIVATLVAGLVLWIVPVIWPASDVAQWPVARGNEARTGFANIRDIVVRLVTYPLPAWSVLAALIGLVLVLRRRPLPLPERTRLALTDKDKSTLEILAVADGERITIDVVAKMVDVRKLK